MKNRFQSKMRTENPALFLFIIGLLGFSAGTVIGMPFGFGANLLEWFGLVTPDSYVPETPIQSLIYVRSYYLKGCFFLGTIICGVFILLNASTIYLDKFNSDELTKGQVRFNYLVIIIITATTASLTAVLAIIPYIN